MNKKIIFSCLLTSMLVIQSPISLFGGNEDSPVVVKQVKKSNVPQSALKMKAGEWLGQTHSYSNKTAVIGVMTIVFGMLIAHKNVRSKIGDFFDACTVIWKNKMPMRSQIETMLDYATSLRDLKNPKHAWKHKGENKLRYAVGTLAAVGVVAAATKYYTGNTYCPWKALRKAKGSKNIQS